MKDPLEKMQDLEYIYGRLVALGKLAGCARQTMAFYGIGCDHPEELPDGDVAIAADYYRKKLKNMEDQVSEESADLFNNLFPAGNRPVAHMNTLCIVWGYTGVLLTILRDMTSELDGYFVDIGADDQKETRKRVIRIIENIGREIQDYQELISELKVSADTKINEIRKVLKW